MNKKSSFEQCLQDRENWCTSHLGTKVPVFPGHPVVLAAMVIDRYATLNDAKAHMGAIRDGFIPGSGCAVWAALDFLDKFHSAGPSAAYKGAEQYWKNWESQQDTNKTAAHLGRLEADKIQPYLEAVLPAWFAGTREPTPYSIESPSQLAA